MSNVEYDPKKDAANRRKHGVSLEAAADFVPVNIVEDTRRDYGENRYQAFGHIEGVAYILVFTPRNNRVRAISLRRASNKEVAANGTKTKTTS